MTKNNALKSCRNQKLVYFYGVLRPLSDIFEKAAVHTKIIDKKAYKNRSCGNFISGNHDNC